ncbi:MAG: N-acetylmuramoyl-L-alanine amidase [Bacteriovorax sp.]|nr:N-acetylmuramoyl-L-alanine amidase [Bacteriovorax sp.]
MKYLLTLLLFLSMSRAFALTILIDPGHGGEEDGARVEVNELGVTQTIKEKDIALAIAKRIHEKLSNAGHSVFLTRSFDRTVTLPERAAIAEKTKADLFISVHINSSPESGAQGFETYYLDNHNDVAIKKVEKTENVQSKGDEVIVQQILVDLVIDQTVTTSKPLAQSIHSQIKNTVGRKYRIHSRGIKPGLFFVLALSKRPGVLLEVGFISTPKERLRMMNPKFQEDYASAVVKGIQNFLKIGREKRLKSRKKKH